jgi:hypothetical protein
MSTAIHNLRNRIQASRKAAAYNDRGFVDVPINDLERLLDIAEKVPASAAPEVSITDEMVWAGCGAVNFTVSEKGMRAALVAAFGKVGNQ